MLLLLTMLLAPAADTISLPWRPVQRIEPAAVVVHRQPAVPVAALRLSLLADDPPGYAGVGHLIQHVIEPMLRSRMAQVGGTATVQRTSDALIYSLAGPAAEIDFMAATLKQALRVPRPDVGTFLQANRELREERLEQWETAPQHVRAVLRAELFPEDIPAAGTASSAARLQPETLPAAWAEMYSPDRLALVAVGDVTTERIRDAFADLPAAAPDGLPARVDTVRTVPPARAEATSGWHALGYVAPADADPAVLSVVARILQGRLAVRLPGARVEVEHWWTHHGQALALVAAAPAPLLDDVLAALETALGTLERRVSDDDATEAARLIRREMLFYSRSPARAAELLGSFADRGSGSPGVQEFYDRLTRVEADDIRDVLGEMRQQSPARAYLPPQRPAEVVAR